MFLARAERTMWVSICTLFLVLYANVAVVDAFSNERNDNVCPLPLIQRECADNCIP